MSHTANLASTNNPHHEPDLEDVVAANRRSPRSVRIPICSPGATHPKLSPASSYCTAFGDLYVEGVNIYPDDNHVQPNVNGSCASLDDNARSDNEEIIPVEGVAHGTEDSLQEINLEDTKSEIKQRYVKYQRRVQDVQDALMEGLRSIGEPSPQEHRNANHDNNTLTHCNNDAIAHIPMHAEHELTRAHELLTRLLHDNVDAAVKLPTHEMNMRISIIVKVASLFFALNRRIVVALERRRDAVVAMLRGHLRDVVGRARAAAGANEAAAEAFGHMRAEMLERVDELDVQHGLSDKYRMWFDRGEVGRAQLKGGAEWSAVQGMNAELRQLCSKVEMLDGRCMEMDEIVRQQSGLMVAERKGEVGDDNKDAEGWNEGVGGDDQGGVVNWKKWGAIAGLLATCAGMVVIGAVYMSVL